jgi:hypothetical protein
MFELILKLSEGFPRPLPDFHPPAEEKLYGHPLGPAELKSDGWHRSFQRCQVFVSPLTAWAKLNCLHLSSIFRSIIFHHFSKVFPSLPSHTVISGGFRRLQVRVLAYVCTATVIVLEAKTWAPQKSPWLMACSSFEDIWSVHSKTRHADLFLLNISKYQMVIVVQQAPRVLFASLLDRYQQALACRFLFAIHGPKVPRCRENQHIDVKTPSAIRDWILDTLYSPPHDLVACIIAKKHQKINEYIINI